MLRAPLALQTKINHERTRQSLCGDAQVGADAAHDIADGAGGAGLIAQVVGYIVAPIVAMGINRLKIRLSQKIAGG